MDAAGTSPPSPEEWLSALDELREQHSTFVVRIHTPPRGGAELLREWRGSVEHMQSRTVLHFNQWIELNRFIAAHSRVAPPPQSLSTRLIAFWRGTRMYRWLVQNFPRTSHPAGKSPESFS